MTNETQRDLSSGESVIARGFRKSAVKEAFGKGYGVEEDLAEYKDCRIGESLQASGKLETADVERVLYSQKKKGLRFGDAAIKLGLVEQRDVQMALAKQFSYALEEVEGKFSGDLVAALAPFTKETEEMRRIRSQLLHRVFNGSRGKMLSIVSPGSGEGRSFLTANLAIVFSQLGSATLVIDADLRNPRQHELFGLPNEIGLATHLRRVNGDSAVAETTSLGRLSVIVAGPTPPNPLELLSGKRFREILENARRHFDVILIDTPPGMKYADAETIAALCSTALLVVRINRTSLVRAKTLVRQIHGYGVEVVGGVLNRH